jgi:hypothetical protein
VSIGDIEPSGSFAIDTPKAGLVQVEEQRCVLRTCMWLSIEEVSHAVVEGFGVLALLLLEDTEACAHGLWRGLDTLVDVDEGWVHVRGVDSLWTARREDRKKDTASTYKGFIISLDLVRNLGKKSLQKLCFSSDPLEERLHGTVSPCGLCCVRFLGDKNGTVRAMEGGWYPPLSHTL